MHMQTLISNAELEKFLGEANRSTYANKDAPKVPPTRLHSEDYHFEKDDLIYHDTYFGGRDFIGGEIVYKSGKPVWGMNYYGYLLAENVDVKDVYDFLRQALLEEYGDVLPVRGPKKFERGTWTYTNEPEGELGRFTGKEEISLDNTVIYRADYHGGFIG